MGRDQRNKNNNINDGVGLKFNAMFFFVYFSVVGFRNAAIWHGTPLYKHKKEKRTHSNPSSQPTHENHFSENKFCKMPIHDTFPPIEASLP